MRISMPQTLALALILPVAACDGLNREEQRALSGGATGAARRPSVDAIIGRPPQGTEPSFEDRLARRGRQRAR
jgi:hypothetical protein